MKVGKTRIYTTERFAFQSKVSFHLKYQAGKSDLISKAQEGSGRTRIRYGATFDDLSCKGIDLYCQLTGKIDLAWASFMG